MPPLSLPIYGQAAGAAEGSPGRASLARRPWRSLEELAGGPRGAAGEFAEGAQEAPPELGRRAFLQLAGAGAALAGLAACKPPREAILPYVRQPPEVSPGTPLHYATALSLDGYATGLLVGCREGRPVKVEGNPLHPASLGAAGAAEQAALLDLYDPARLQGFVRRGAPTAFRTVLAELDKLARAHAADGGARLAFLLAPSASPLLGDLRRRLRARFPGARLRSWTAASEDASREGARIAFGRPLEARLHLDKAAVALVLDGDPLGAEGEALRNARGFASRRAPGPEMSRLYVAESRLSVTGTMADHRFRMRSSEVPAFARAVAAELAALGASGLAAAGPAEPPPEAVRRRAAAVARDLWKARAAGLVVAGGRQPAAVHALAHAVNAALGSVGTAVTYHAPGLHEAEAGSRGLADLAAELASGRVDTLVVTAWNPVYTAPADADLGAALARVRDSIYLALREDETSRRASWVLSASHPFETWGDARSRDGTVTIAQPLLAPLHESLSEVELLAAFVGDAGKGAFELVQGYWRARAGASFDADWRRWLAEGTVPGTALAPESVAPAFDAVAAEVRAWSFPATELEVGFVPDEKALDGRFADNAWMQELPHPVTKITWDNAALVSPATAGKMGLSNGDVVAVGCHGKSLEAPVWVLPGHADGAVTLALGYGRAVAGPAGRGVGFDAYRLRHAGAPWFDAGSLVKVGRRHPIAATQEHFRMEGRLLALDFTVADWASRGRAEAAGLRGPVPTAQVPVDYSGQDYKWGMAVDLSRCTGCSACVVACQEENNIPVVGKEQVGRGREMHWLRIDRYFAGSAEEPEVLSQPVACVHCETAPCEYVCPANATMHSDEGLNEMIYNRCVGTRYCSNNCPYKVRRFNYLDWVGTRSPTERMLANPDVTVRARGVMEKCTYCVQRIERARIHARNEGRKIRDGEVRPACQQACPAEAIVFGNLNDPASRVSRLHQDERRYDLLHENGTRPRTAYLARIRNPNPELA